MWMHAVRCTLLCPFLENERETNAVICTYKSSFVHTRTQLAYYDNNFKVSSNPHL